jgi:5,5'-dehydrodivanillate O-demethylase
MSEDFTLFRGESGKAYLTQYRCAHRGTPLSVGWVEGDSIRCRYHGWKFDGTGQCVEQPDEPKPFCNRIKLKNYPVQEQLGLIFAYFGEGQPPSLPEYPLFETGHVFARSTVRHCNYFNNIDNHLDNFHAEWTHRDRATPHRYACWPEQMPPYQEISETDWGVTSRVRLADGNYRSYVHGMPNMLQFCTEPVVPCGATVVDAMSWRIPVDDSNHLTFTIVVVPLHGEAAEKWQEQAVKLQQAPHTPNYHWVKQVLGGEMTIEDIKTLPDFEQSRDLINIQDEVTQVGQGVIANRNEENLGAADRATVLVRKVWLRELQNLIDGRPLKQWACTKDIRPLPGIEMERQAASL